MGFASKPDWRDLIGEPQDLSSKYRREAERAAEYLCQQDRIAEIERQHRQLFGGIGTTNAMSEMASFFERQMAEEEKYRRAIEDARKWMIEAERDREMRVALDAAREHALAMATMSDPMGDVSRTLFGVTPNPFGSFDDHWRDLIPIEPVPNLKKQIKEAVKEAVEREFAKRDPQPVEPDESLYGNDGVRRTPGFKPPTE